MIINDRLISSFALQGNMIEPFVGNQVRFKLIDGNKIGVISYGLGSYGYDIRLSKSEFYIYEASEGYVDPKAFDKGKLLRKIEISQDENGFFFEIPGNCGGVGVALEKLKMPENITALGFGKSTYTRSGLFANIPPIEAGWEGHLTLSFTNTNKVPVRIYADEGVAQLVFFEGESCTIAYGDRDGGGKYQGQGEEVTISKV